MGARTSRRSRCPSGLRNACTVTSFGMSCADRQEHRASVAARTDHQQTHAISTVSGIVSQHETETSTSAQRFSPPLSRWESAPACSTARPKPPLSRRRASKSIPMWPKPLPNHWVMGNTIGVSVDASDHVWIIHRAGSLEAKEIYAVANPPGADCCLPAPPVLEFDQEGNLIGHWGGPGQGYDWPDSNHGITVDYKGNVWIGGNGRGPQPKGEAPVEGAGSASRAVQGQRNSKVHAGRKVPDADRQARPEQGQQRYRQSEGSRQDVRRSARPTNCTSPTATATIA